MSVEALRNRVTLTRQWNLACRSAKLLGTESGAPPALDIKSATADGTITAIVKCGHIGVPVADLVKQADRLAAVITCREVVVREITPSVAQLVFHWRDPIGRALPLADVPVPAPATPPVITYGIRQDGSPATVKATESVLIGGLTRKGKSNFVWASLANLLLQGIYVDLYVSDPKGGVELDQLESVMDRALDEAERTGQVARGGGRLLRVREYAKSAAETIKMVDAAEKGMHARQFWMKQNGTRKVVPDETNPLVVIILDETLPLTDMLKKGTDSSLGRVAYTGAAAAYVVWANTQVAQIDAIGRFRDLVPQRVCFATSSPQVTDAVLGAGSEALGAHCSQISEAGVGFSYAEGDRVPRKFRCALVTDAETRTVAAGQLPPSVVNKARESQHRALEAAETKSGKSRRTALYRHFYVEDPEYGDSLGYVGISYDTLAREAQHVAGLRAFMETARREVRTEWFDTRAEALAAEKLAIENEKPIWNKQHNQGNRRRRIDVAGKLRRDRDKVA